MTHSLIKRFYPVAMFCTLGTINAGLNFLLFTVFWKLLHINYLFAVTLTFILTAAFQFFSNRKMTFKVSGNLQHQMVKYFILLGINYLMILLVMHTAVSTFGFSPYIGVFLSIFYSGIASFLLFKFWVFRHPSVAL